MKLSLTKVEESATSACWCRRVNASVQRYSVQYKGYNLVEVITVEGGATRGKTAQVYWQLHSSLYTGTVQGYWSTPDWSDRRPGVQEVSRILHNNTLLLIFAVIFQWYWLKFGLRHSRILLTCYKGIGMHDQNLFCCFLPSMTVHRKQALGGGQIWEMCSETSLTGESRFHISPPRGFEPVTLVAGSKQVSPLDQWDMVRIMWDCRLSTGLPPAADCIGCEARRETCSERETGTGKLCEIKWDYHIVSTRA
jgi:hypothetical protein